MGEFMLVGLVFLSERGSVLALTEELGLKDGWCTGGSRITSGHFS